MSLLFMLLGGLVGAGLGWLVEKVIRRKQPAPKEGDKTST